MKKANMTILVSIFVMALVAAGVSLGTGAWFSTEPVNAGDTVFTSGIMAMQSLDAGPFSTPANWKPGDSFTVIFELENTGNLDIGYLATTFTIDRVGATGLEYASKIEVTEWWELIPGVGWQDNFAEGQLIHTLVGDKVYPLTLLEAVQSYTSGELAHHAGANDETETFCVLDQFGNWVNGDSDYVTGSGYDQEDGPAIIAGSVNYKMQITFEFMESAGNDLQGETLELYTSFFGFQDYSQRP